MEYFIGVLVGFFLCFFLVFSDKDVIYISKKQSLPFFKETENNGYVKIVKSSKEEFLKLELSKIKGE